MRFADAAIGWGGVARLNRLYASARTGVALGLILAVTACASSPTQQIEREAEAYGFVRETIPGTLFSHVVYLNGPLQAWASLHVYLDGDGSPWILGRFVADDPTPRQPLMLRLMALDPAPSLYLGRPCYNGLAYQPPCDPRFWTYGRYAREVVDSMAVALEFMLNRAGVTGLVLMGHSGGGTLAMLLAERLGQTRAVVTIAGNLDPDAWTQYHGYSPLWTSLNPANRAPLRSNIRQLHLVGDRDQNIPPAMVYKSVSHQAHKEIRIIPGFDHNCCWYRIWPAVLEALAENAPFKPNVSPSRFRMTSAGLRRRRDFQDSNSPVRSDSKDTRKDR